MILELGLFRIEPARAEEFAPIAEEIRTVFARGGIRGLRSFSMAPAIEDPARWVVLVGWDAVSDHRAFVESPEGRRQRVVLEGYMTEEPDVFHLDLQEESGST